MACHKQHMCNRLYFITFALIICPLAIAYHGTDYKITYITLSFCQSVCKHSYGRSFDSILIKFCSLIQGLKSKIEFV